MAEIDFRSTIVFITDHNEYTDFRLMLHESRTAICKHFELVIKHHDLLYYEVKDN